MKLQSRPNTEHDQQATKMVYEGLCEIQDFLEQLLVLRVSSIALTLAPSTSMAVMTTIDQERLIENIAILRGIQKLNLDTP